MIIAQRLPSRYIFVTYSKTHSTPSFFSLPRACVCACALSLIPIHLAYFSFPLRDVVFPCTMPLLLYHVHFLLLFAFCIYSILRKLSCPGPLCTKIFTSPLFYLFIIMYFSCSSFPLPQPPTPNSSLPSRPTYPSPLSPYLCPLFTLFISGIFSSDILCFGVGEL